MEILPTLLEGSINTQMGKLLISYLIRRQFWSKEENNCFTRWYEYQYYRIIQLKGGILYNNANALWLWTICNNSIVQDKGFNDLHKSRFILVSFNEKNLTHEVVYFIVK